jgi:hypothetical protein
MKLAWLQECAINLNKEDPVVSSHVPRILSIVNKRLEDWIKNASLSGDIPHGQIRTAKMLLMMTASLV